MKAHLITARFAALGTIGFFLLVAVLSAIMGPMGLPLALLVTWAVYYGTK